MVGFSPAEGHALGDPSVSRDERTYLVDHGRTKKKTGTTSNGKVCDDECQGRFRLSVGIYTNVVHCCRMECGLRRRIDCSQIGRRKWGTNGRKLPSIYLAKQDSSVLKGGGTG